MRVTSGIKTYPEAMVALLHTVHLVLKTFTS